MFSVAVISGTSSGKELLDLAQDIDESVDFVSSVVEIKAGTRGGFHAELAHKRLVAMMAATQRNAALIGHRDQIVGVNIFEQKAHQSGAANVRAENPNTPFKLRKLRERISPEFLIVMRDPVTSDLIQVIHRRM